MLKLFSEAMNLLPSINQGHLLFFLLVLVFGPHLTAQTLLLRLWA